ncbi:MAG: helix-turn-helix transcriptional regulator [Eubacteriales bacterium]
MYKHLKSILRSKTFRAMLISYAILLIIPIISSVIVLGNAIRIIDSQLKEMSRFSAMQIQMQVDSVLSEVVLSANTIASNSDIKKQIGLSINTSLENRYALSKFTKLLYQYEQLDTIDSAFLYISGSKTMVTTKYIYHDGQTKDLLEELFDFDFDGIVTFAKRNYQGTFYTKRTSSGIDLYYLYPVVAEKSSSIDGAVIIKVSDDVITGVIGDRIYANSAAFVMAEDGSQYLAVGWDSETGNDLIGHLGNGYETAESNSKVSNMQYVTAISKGDYYKPVKQLIVYIIIYIIIVISFGSFYSVTQTRKRYAPVERALAAVKKSHDGGDEFQIIENALTELNREKSELENYRKKQYETERENLLRGLLTENVYQKENFVDQLQLHDISLAKGYCLVAIFNVENYSDLFFGTEDLGETELFELTYVIIRSVTEELLSSCSVSYVIKFNGSIVSIISMRDNEQLDSVKRNLNDIFVHIIDFIRQNFGIKIFVSVSPAVSSPSELPVAYTMSLAASDAALLQNLDEPCVFYDEVTISADSEWNDFLNKYKVLSGMLLNGNYTGALALINEAASQTFSKEGVNRKTAINRLNIIINILFEALENLFAGDSKALLEFERKKAELCSANTPSRFITSSDGIAQMIKRYTKADNQGKNEISRKICKYIDENFSNPDLGIPLISDKFGLSASYISRIFKRSNNTTILVYINTRRIEAAKELLSTTNMSIKDIAGKVGYRTPYTLTKTIRKMEGVSPDFYRKNPQNMRQGSR